MGVDKRMKDENTGHCKQVLVHDQIPWFDVATGLAQLFILFVLLVRQRQQRRLALSGDEVAARVLILPVYVYILMGFLGAVVIEVAFHAIAIIFPKTVQHNHQLSTSLSGLAAVASGCYSFVFQGLALLLLQQGAGQRSQRRAFLMSLLFAGIFTGCYFVYELDQDKYWQFDFAPVLFLFLCYLLALVLPMTVLYRRPAMRNYAIFWVVCLGLRVIATLSQHVPALKLYYSCIYIVQNGFLFHLVKPFIVYSTLLRDSEYWQGLCMVQKNFSYFTKADTDSQYNDLQSPLLGVSLSRNAARHAASFADTFAVQTATHATSDGGSGVLQQQRSRRGGSGLFSRSTSGLMQGGGRRGSRSGLGGAERQRE